MGYYIIEINDKYKQVVLLSAEGELYCKDVAGLMPYTEPDIEQVREEAYQQGLNDAWEAARKIIHMPEADLLNLFTECYSAVCTSVQVFLKYDASECIEKIRQYEQEKEEIKAGDEVVGLYGTRFNMRGFVTKANNNLNFHVVWDEGDTGYYAKGDFRKTGRHFPEIAEVMQKMREE